MLYNINIIVTDISSNYYNIYWVELNYDEWPCTNHKDYDPRTILVEFMSRNDGLALQSFVENV